jgi:hypothetical protein
MKAFLYSYFKGANFNLKDSLPKFKNFGYDGQSKYVIQKTKQNKTNLWHAQHIKVIEQTINKSRRFPKKISSDGEVEGMCTNVLEYW